jgi:heptosyltransferase-3
MECLRAEYLEVWVASQNTPLIRFADKVDSIANAGLDLFGLPSYDPPARLLERLRGFDSIVSWYGANRPEFQEAVRALQLPFHFLPALPDTGAAMHAADFYLGQVGAISVCDGSAIPHIDCPKADDGFAVIHPFSGSPKKNWPLERYRQLADWLSERMPVHWCVQPDDEPGMEAVRIADLYQLACWLARARLYIGNDSGITHLAAAVGAPVVALFGPTDPAIWAPRGSCVRIVATAAPMESIAIEQVMAAVRSVCSENFR